MHQDMPLSPDCPAGRACPQNHLLHGSLHLLRTDAPLCREQMRLFAETCEVRGLHESSMSQRALEPSAVHRFLTSCGAQLISNVYDSEVF